MPESSQPTGDLTKHLAPERLRWTPELVERFWTGFSQTRLEDLSFSRTAGGALLLAVRHLIAAQGRCLDFGAGSGDLVEHLLAAGYTTAAWEPSSGRRRVLHERFAGREGFAGTAERDSAGTYDAVFFVEVIEHVLDEVFDDTVALVASMLRPGGTLIVTTPNNEDLELGMCYCPVSNLLFHRWQHVRSFTAESLTAALARHGIVPIAVHQVEFTPALFAPLASADTDEGRAALPDYLVGIRTNVPVRMGSESSILYVGRKTASGA